MDIRSASEFSPFTAILSRIEVSPFYSNCWKNNERWSRQIRQKRRQIWRAKGSTELNCIFKWVFRFSHPILELKGTLESTIHCHSSPKARWVYLSCWDGRLPLGEELQRGAVPTWWEGWAPVSTSLIARKLFCRAQVGLPPSDTICWLLVVMFLEQLRESLFFFLSKHPIESKAKQSVSFGHVFFRI